LLAEKKKIKIDKELLKERIKLLNVNLKKKDEVKKRKSAEIELEKKKKAKPVVSGGKKEKKKEAEGARPLSKTAEKSEEAGEGDED